MPSSDVERQPIWQGLACLLAFLLSAAAVALIMRTAWHDWTVFAMAWAAMYFMGAARWFPWGTPLRKAFAMGVFLGTALPTIEWLYYLNH